MPVQLNIANLRRLYFLPGLLSGLKHNRDIVARKYLWSLVVDSSAGVDESDARSLQALAGYPDAAYGFGGYTRTILQNGQTLHQWRCFDNSD